MNWKLGHLLYLTDRNGKEKFIFNFKQKKMMFSKIHINRKQVFKEQWCNCWGARFQIHYSPGQKISVAPWSTQPFPIPMSTIEVSLLFSTGEEIDFHKNAVWRVWVISLCLGVMIRTCEGFAWGRRVKVSTFNFLACTCVFQWF